ncbi:hypothetical protein ACIRF8_08390 [Streptomyces sp. NPDC102406]|uniref:hypothetical protein n=1 Tax=Streptomyces sp. NPDC102406 TaxID=3366171 RepID=UPI003801D162
MAALLLAALTATGLCGTLRRMPPGTVLDRLLTARPRLRRRARAHASACVPARAEVVAVSAVLTALTPPIRWWRAAGAASW